MNEHMETEPCPKKLKEIHIFDSPARPAQVSALLLVVEFLNLYL